MKVRVARPEQKTRSLGMGKVRALPECVDKWGKPQPIHAMVWRHPKDFPTDYVVRLWVIPDAHLGNLRPKPVMFDEVFLVADMEQARDLVRKLLPRHVCVGRSPLDDLALVEAWQPPKALILHDAGKLLQ